jgi:flap endonuclease-1
MIKEKSNDYKEGTSSKHPMGLKFKDIVVKREITIKDLKGKVLAVDAFNILYQFLTTIRGPDGSVLTDKEGRVTSHLIGLFNRTTSLMEEGLKLVFVFDGKAPELKKRTWEKRSDVKEQATLKLAEAEAAGNLEDMKKFAARTVSLNKEMLENAKEIITLLGLPIVQAPSEGEAQATHMVKNGDAYAVVSQDFDNLIFGCPLMVKNLSIAGKRKRAGKFAFVTVKPELLSLKEILLELKLDLDQLIVLAILVGTDYNPGGIKGIGPKKGLKLVQEHGRDFPALFKDLRWDEDNALSWEEIFATIKEMKVTDDYKLEWSKVDEKLAEVLVEKYDFSEERVKSKLDKLQTSQGAMAQKGLGSFF